jgi:hypothetical protein
MDAVPPVADEFSAGIWTGLLMEQWSVFFLSLSLFEPIPLSVLDYIAKHGFLLLAKKLFLMHCHLNMVRIRCAFIAA